MESLLEPWVWLATGRGLWISELQIVSHFGVSNSPVMKHLTSSSALLSAISNWYIYNEKSIVVWNEFQSKLAKISLLDNFAAFFNLREKSVWVEKPKPSFLAFSHVFPHFEKAELHCFSYHKKKALGLLMQWYWKNNERFQMKLPCTQKTNNS